MGEGEVLSLVLDVEDDGVALVEGAALGVLTAEANGRAGGDQRGEGGEFRHAIVEGTRAGGHLAALLEELLDLGVQVEAGRHDGGEAREFGDAFRRQAGGDIVLSE